MAKKESSFVNMVMTLLVVTAVASFTLASVYNITKGPIEMAREAARQQAITMVVPAFDELSRSMYMPADGRDSLEFNYAYKDGQLVGVAVATYTDMGFSGRIRAMVGFYPDGRIVDVVHLQHTETPGLGDKIEKSKSDWSDQFRDMDPSTTVIKVTKDGGQVDAITAATITARAYCDGIRRAYETFSKHVLTEGGSKE